MLGLVEVLGRVPVRRAVAAPHVTTSPAEAQMHPPRTDLQTLLAAERAWRHLPDSGRMRTFVGHHTLPRSPVSARNAWIVAITWAPSPTAAATRLVDPARASPIANTPSRLVSSGRRPTPTSAPVRTNPFASSATSDADSHDVLGSAPM